MTTSEEDILAAYRRAGGVAITEPLQQALLTFPSADSTPGVVLPVLIYEGARDGFLALVKDPPNLWVDDAGSLETEDRSWDVCVVSVHRIESEQDIETDGPRVFRIGLDCVREIRSPSDVGRRRAFLAKLTSLVPMERTETSWRNLLTVSLVSAPMLVVVLVWNRDNPMVSKVFGWSNVPLQGAPPGPTSGQPGPRSEQPVNPLVAARHLPGVEPFLLPEVAACLNLTAEQRAALGRLGATTQQAMQQLDTYWKKDSPAARAKKREMILDAAHQEAMRLLTDQQRQQWNGK